MRGKYTSGGLRRDGEEVRKRKGSKEEKQGRVRIERLGKKKRKNEDNFIAECFL